MIVAAAVVAAVLIVLTVALVATRAKPVPAPRPAGDDGWTATAGSELAGLSESDRCDLVFAVAALGDDASRALLERALGDSSEAVALAAAHALARRGGLASVEQYFTRHPGVRADRIAATLTLLETRP